MATLGWRLWDSLKLATGKNLLTRKKPKLKFVKSLHFYQKYGIIKNIKKTRKKKSTFILTVREKKS